MRRFKMLFLGFVSIVMVVACASSPRTESAGQFLDSSAITAKVKANLVDKLGTKGFAVKVKTYKDEVQLSGFVNTQWIKNKAGVIASDVEGVHSVRNDLIVKTR